MKESESLQLARQFLGREVEVEIDRPLGSKHPRHNFTYELNYGFVPGTKAPDGAELDAYIIDSDKALEKTKGTCIAIVHRENDDDDKLVVSESGAPISDEKIMELVNFQEQWFDSHILRK